MRPSNADQALDVNRRRGVRTERSFALASGKFRKLWWINPGKRRQAQASGRFLKYMARQAAQEAEIPAKCLRNKRDETRRKRLGKTKATPNLTCASDWGNRLSASAWWQVPAPASLCGTKAMSMRALMLEPPEELLAERRRKGADRWDEVWDGVLHMVPPPTGWHQRFGSELFATLRPAAKDRGLEIAYETGLFERSDEFRVPDIALYREAHFRGEQGLVGAEFVVEILSPRDESKQKLDFYASRLVPELLYVDPKTRVFDLYVLRSESYFILKDDHGAAHSAVLGVTFSLVDGPKLRVSTASGFTDV